MTIDLGGSRRGYNPNVPKLKKDETELYNIRLAAPEDIPFIAEMYDRSQKRSMISCLRDDKIWRYEMLEQHETFRSDMTIVETLEGEPVGFIWHNNKLHGTSLDLFFYELKPRVSWSAVTPTVIRYLKSKGESYASKDDEVEWESFGFRLGTNHPAFAVAAEYLPEYDPPYAWYIRIHDLPDFLQHISPVLEQRLSESEHAGYSGKLLLDFHRSGVKFILEDGAITAVKYWQPSTEERGDLAFPDLSFHHLICGYRSFDELRDFHPDCYSRKKPEAPALINTLFPKKTSYVLGIV
jgi:hypothetical protein